MDSGNSSNNQVYKTSAASSKKDGFHVKSGVWADSLSRGLIDLNISGPKKVDLTDVGIVGGVSSGTEEKDKVLPNSLLHIETRFHIGKIDTRFHIKTSKRTCSHCCTSWYDGDLQCWYGFGCCS